MPQFIKNSVSFLAFRLFSLINCPWMNGTTTDYGCPMEPFFIKIPNFWGLSWQFGQINFGAFEGIFGQFSAPILVQWVPCPSFPTINHYSYKLSLYTHPNLKYLFGIGIRIWIWAAKSYGFSHHVSVVRGHYHCF